MSVFTKFGRVKRFHIMSQRGNSFLQAPWAGGIVLVVCVMIAMLLANLPATSHWYHQFLHMELGLSIGGELFPQSMSLEKFVNDALMVIFFFTVGLEIRREMSHGELSTPKKAILPVIAALGGMLAPALIYTCFNFGTEAINGWGIPTATDIAFAIGIMSLLGNRVPISLKVFLTALAVADDLGAIVVIALFYGETPNMLLLGIALLIMVGIYFMRRMGEYRVIAYLIPAFVVWTLFYYSGVHATISGVAMAMLIPTTPRYSRSYYLHKADIIEKGIRDADLIEDRNKAEEERLYHIHRMKQISNGAESMSHRVEHFLMPYVNFLIMPIFALVNAGVHIESVEYFNIFEHSAAAGSIGMGIFFGLVVGKPLGISLFSYLAIKLGLADKPAGASWKMLVAVACLGGIGFTMSIFVDNLAFDAATHLDYINKGKISILMASTAAAVLGSVLIVLNAKKK
ncbi:MAG: Na+/H+ antiporter NhaA [Alistipes sp.]|nr:Na+/H+ antiporter NhaA [Alistipes sp.]MBO7307412.1 Na+/H+ antiporter NhaA [Alistipes sp.]